MEHNDTPTTPTPTEPEDGHQPLLRRRVGLVALGLAVTLPVLGLAVNGVAGADEGSTEVVESIETVEGEGEGECPPLLPEEVADSNAEQDELAAFLDEWGIPHIREADHDGINWVGPELDATDAELEQFDTVSEAFYALRYPLDPETLAEWNAEEDALAAHFDERGIPYTREANAQGVHEVIWDWNDDRATEAWNELQAELYPMSPDELAEANAEQDELAAFFDERGISYTREIDAYGVDWVVWDENDEAANEAHEEFYADFDDSESCVVVSG